MFCVSKTDIYIGVNSPYMIVIDWRLCLSLIGLYSHFMSSCRPVVLHNMRVCGPVVYSHTHNAQFSFVELWTRLAININIHPSHMYNLRLIVDYTNY